VVVKCYPRKRTAGKHTSIKPATSKVQCTIIIEAKEYSHGRDYDPDQERSETAQVMLGDGYELERYAHIICSTHEEM
jgi:hypothetical protein